MGLVVLLGRPDEGTSILVDLPVNLSGRGFAEGDKIAYQAGGPSSRTSPLSTVVPMEKWPSQIR